MAAMMLAAPEITVETAGSFSERDLADLCDASESAVLEGDGFGWLGPPPRHNAAQGFAASITTNFVAPTPADGPDAP